MRFVNLIFKKINKKAFFIAILLFLFLIIAGNFVYAQAESTHLPLWQDALLITLSKIIYAPVWISGKLIGVMMGLFLSAARYNDFIIAAPVLTGWEIIRDLCNMGFIIVLLIIAIGSILRIESYSYRTWLPKLVIMAVLINFSKAICGVVIDIAQIVMLTFVSGISEIGMGNFADMVGLNRFLSFSNYAGVVAKAEAGSEGITALSIAGTMILALVFSLITLVVITAITLVLVIRIAALWILVILSPFAFLFSASPAGNKYASQWVQSFTKWVFTGPVLAFFIWLSFLTVKGTGNVIFGSQKGSVVVGGAMAGLADIGRIEVMGTFIVAIVMLMASLVVAQQLGGMAASVAGSAYRSITSRWDKTVSGVRSVVRSPWTGAKELANVGTNKLHKYTGVDLNLKRAWAGVKRQKEYNKAKDYTEGATSAQKAMEEGGRAHGLLAMTGKQGEAWDYVMNWKNFGGLYRERRKGGKQLKDIRKNLEKEKKEEEFKRDFTEADKTKQNKMLFSLEKEKEKKEQKIASSNEYSNKFKEATKEKDRIEERIEFAKDTQKKGIESGGFVKFKADFVNQTKQQQEAELKTISDKRGKIEKKLQDEDIKNEEREKLQAKKESIDKNYKFAQGAIGKNINIEKAKTDKSVKTKIESYKQENEKVVNDFEKTKKRIENLGDEIARNIPEYSFEAAAADDKLVREEMSKISGVENSDQLNLMLRDAIKDHDKIRIKALTKKMTMRADENEFLSNLKYSTNYKGLQEFMKNLATKGHKHYGGFSKQEAYELGADISEKAKLTKHWEATGGFKIENGDWRPTTEKEHIASSNIEQFKYHLQDLIRKNNRLAYGEHDKDTGKFHLTKGGLVTLKLMDNPGGWKQWQTNGQMNAAIHLSSDDSTRRMKEAGISDKLINTIKERAGSASGMEDFDTDKIADEIEKAQTDPEFREKIRQENVKKEQEEKRKKKKSEKKAERKKGEEEETAMDSD
ncbi:MAG: hypothetical protein GWO87_01170 [Xanthomonadaceae bacterium]|nr:hypothetical protein [Rhodospirillaceae bacterium]NIA17786.1 hypothetical protein [Xanthomonadaceae bacterium]